MKKTLSIAAAAAAVLLAAGLATSAGATQYVGTFNESVFTGPDSSGLIIETEPNALGLNFTLNGAATKTIDLFDIWTNEPSLDTNDTHAKTITVNFNFSLPNAQTGQVTGQTFGVDGQFFVRDGVGEVTWNGPTTVNFGGTSLTIQLDNETFNAGNIFCPSCLNPGLFNSADVLGHFTQTVNPGVPEPASWALMITGFGMAGGMLRRRRTAVAAVA
jgi:hypothetical protein